MKATAPLAALGLTLALAATPASAVVTEWGYTISSAFTSQTFSSGGGYTSVTPNQLRWGDGPTNYSALTVGNSPATGSVNTYLGSAPPASAPFLGLSTSLTHENNVISGNDKTLLSAVLTNHITLDPIIPNNPALPQQVVPFTIAFAETPNTPGTCAAASPTPCNDIFVLTSGLLNFSFDYNDGSGSAKYYVKIFPTENNVLSELSAAVCNAAGVTPGINDTCIGFTTEENKDTTLKFGFTISTAPLNVPEPGALALMGIGLAGLAGIGRRRRR